MKAVAAGVLGGAVVSLTLVIAGGAQERPATTTPKDPRVGLAAGFKDAGKAALNLDLVSNVPKPEGFFDPKSPAGEPTPPETKDSEEETKPSSETKPESKPAGDDPKAADAESKPSRGSGALNFANSDLAFRGNHLFIGNFSGYNIYDIGNPKKLELLASIVCPGGQGDVSVHGNLLFMSVEETRGRLDCGTQGVQETISAERFRGVRIFDISDLKKPKQIAAVQTCRGSHTHTLLVDPDDKANVYIYGSGTSSVRPGEELAGCSGLAPEKDPDTALFSIDVIQVPVSAPETARIVSRPRIFADPRTGTISGLWKGGDHGPGTQKTSETNRCHDITVFPSAGLAAGACSGNGILLDISDPVNPVRLDHVIDKNFAFWHSATFNNDGTKVIFTDEWGGGTRPRCRPTDLPTWGANAIFDIVERKMQFASYYKLPAPQTDTENCVAHNGSLIPVPGRDIMVQAWYQGGVSVFDFTDSAKPYEIAYFDRGPLDAKQLITGGHWSAYWYNGLIYGAEIARGLDVFRLKPSKHLSQNEIDAATLVKATEFNAQQQPHVIWPSEPAVARAYLDQLTRTKSIQAERAGAIDAALKTADRRSGLNPEMLSKLDALGAQLESDASGASASDAARLRALAGTLKKIGRS
jgi:hypothetical protein